MHSNIFALSTNKNYDSSNLPSEDDVFEEMDSVADYVTFEFNCIENYERMAEAAGDIAHSIPGATSEGNKIHIENVKESIKTLLKNKIDIAIDLLSEQKKRNDKVSIDKGDHNEDIFSMKLSIYRALEILHDRFGWYIIDLDDGGYAATYDRYLGDLVMKDNQLDLYVIASYDYHF